MSTIKTLDHPFQVGTKIAVVNHYNRVRNIVHIMTVSKTHKNGLVKLQHEPVEGSTVGYEIKDNFRPVSDNIIRIGGEVRVGWSLRNVSEKSRRGGYRTYQLYTPELVAKIEAEQAEHETAHRQKDVRQYLANQLQAFYYLELSPDQLARINAILNE